MLNFRNTNFFFLILIGILIPLNLIISFSWIIYLIVGLIYSAILFYGCYFIQSNFFIKVICSSATYKREIAISFDDGPAENYTNEILNILKESNIKASFFCIGKRIAGNEELIKRIHEEGHIIGNHSYSHAFWFDLFSSNKMSKDLILMDNKMKEVIGIKPKFFRPPYGVLNPNLKKAIQKGNYITVGWNVRSMDTVIKDKSKLFDKIIRSLKPGAVILFHDTSKTTMDILPQFIQETILRGYSIIRLDKLINKEAYA